LSVRAPSRARLKQRPLAWAVLLAGLFAPAAAQAAGATYRLQLVRADGAGSCPSALQIERDVTQRLGRNPFSDEGERGIDIVLSRTETRWQANLYLRIDASDSDHARLIESEAADCAELGKSVALAVALAISPELPPEVAPKVEPVCPPPPLPNPPPPPKPSLHGEASLRLLLSPNLLPTSSLGTALAVTLRGELVGASFGGIFYPESELQNADAHVGFGVSAAFASGCLWARTHDPQVWSCIGARAGALHSVVYDPRPEQPGDHFWWAASSELGLRQHLFGRAFLEAGATAVFPFVRHRFQVDASGGAASPAQARTVYEQGPAVVEGFVGVGLRLD
jgi:hypothetical protein